MSTETYRQYTKPAELHKAMNTLRGIVVGIADDGHVSDAEIQELVHWCSLHAHLADRHPFSELLPLIEESVSDGVITFEEKTDIIWVCQNFTTKNPYYDMTTSAIQYLNGLIHGVLADGKLSDDEIHILRQWVTDADFLQGTYPFDELNAILHDIFEDGYVTEEERNVLTAFLSNFVEFKDSYNLVESDFDALREQYSVGGICAHNPEIQIEGKLFCFTGEAVRSTRKELKNTITELGGIFRDSVSKKTDYLVVGGAGNPCWAYSCYGRKIEEAMTLRRSGAKVQIIKEDDFWNAASVNN